MTRNKGSDEPNVNEALKNIQKRREMAKSKTVEGGTKASDSLTKEKTPPASPNPKVPTPKPTPEGTHKPAWGPVYLHYALHYRVSYIQKHDKDIYLCF